MPKSKESEPNKGKIGRRNPYEWVYDPFAPTEEERRQEGFEELVDEVIPMFWMFILKGPEDMSIRRGKGFEVTLVDIYSRKKKKFLNLKSEGWSIPAQLIRQGYVPGAPSNGRTAYSFELMVLYEHMLVARGSMDFGHFFESICDLQSVKFSHNMKIPFKRAFEQVYTPIAESCTGAGEAIRAKYPVPSKDELTRIFGERKMMFYDNSVDDLIEEHSCAFTHQCQ